MHPTSNEIYDAFAPYYSSYSEKKSKYLKTVDSLILKNIVPITHRVLDIGCGDGSRGAHLFSLMHASELLMIDSSKNMYELAKKFENKNIRVLRADISEPDLNSVLPRNHFDTVLCLWNVLGHITDYQKRIHALANIKKLMKSDAILFVDISNRYNISYYGWKIVAKNIWNDLLHPRHDNGTFGYTIDVGDKGVKSYCHFFNPREFRSMCDKVGFRIVKTFYVDYESGLITKTWLSGHMFYMLVAK